MNDPTFGGSTTCPDVSIITDWEWLTKIIKAHVKKTGTLPETTTEYYKLVKEIGKGAFGKVSLAIHKLSGR